MERFLSPDVLIEKMNNEEDSMWPNGKLTQEQADQWSILNRLPIPKEAKMKIIQNFLKEKEDISHTPIIQSTQ